MISCRWVFSVFVTFCCALAPGVSNAESKSTAKNSSKATSKAKAAKRVAPKSETNAESSAPPDAETSAQSNVDATAPTPNQEARPSLDSEEEPLPQGFDESFKSGDLPKPIVPELDPDHEDEELNPEKKSTEAAIDELLREEVPDRFKFGFSASLSFPHIINLGIETMWDKSLGVSLNYGKIQRNLDKVNVDLQHADLRLRWFPWQSSFFAGLGLGQHQLIGEMDHTVKHPTSGAAVTAHGKLSTTSRYVLPHIGWFAVWDSGFTAGFDVGYLVPSGAKSKFKSTFSNAAGAEAALMETAEYKKLKSDLEDNSKKYASKPAIYITLLRFGWMF